MEEKAEFVEEIKKDSVKKVKHHKEERDIVGAIFLIFIGVIFLLNTTGILEWGIWMYLLRFWPIFLVLAGIRLVAGKSVVAEIVISIVALILFVLVSLISYVSYTAKNIDFLPNNWNEAISNSGERFFSRPHDFVSKELEVLESEYDFENVVERDISFKIGASKLNIEDSEEKKYFNVNAEYYEDYEKPILESSLNNKVLDINFKNEHVGNIMFWSNRTSTYSVQYGYSDLKTSIDLELGAGESVINLDHTNISKLSSQVGAGKVEITLGEKAIPSEEINIEVGAGDTVLNLPSNIGFSLSYDLGVGDIHVDGEKIASFAGSEEEYKSRNYDFASKLVNIKANVGVGSLKINFN